MAIRDILIVLVFSFFKNSNLVVNIAVSNVQIRIYLFLKSNVYILNIEVFSSTMLLNKNLGITFYQVIMEEDNEATSHKGEKIKSYPLQFKLDAISFAQIHGNRAAERKFKPDRKRLQEWREKKC